MLTFKFTTVTGGEEFTALAHGTSQLDALCEFIGLMIAKGYAKDTPVRCIG